VRHPQEIFEGLELQACDYVAWDVVRHVRRLRLGGDTICPYLHVAVEADGCSSVEEHD
jgi:hypothetical protein